MARRTARTRLVGGGVHGSLSAGSRVGGRAVTHQGSQLWDSQLTSRPLVHIYEPWRDDAQIEQPADRVLIDDVVVERALERVTMYLFVLPLPRRTRPAMIASGVTP